MLESRKKLEGDEQEAEEALFVLQQQFSVAVNRLTRIRKTRKRIEERSKELVQRGMQELDSEDGISKSLESGDRFIVDDLRGMGVSGEVDWSSLGLGDPSLDPLLMVGSGFDGGSLQASGGSASNA